MTAHNDRSFLRDTITSASRSRKRHRVPHTTSARQTRVPLRSALPRGGARPSAPGTAARHYRSGRRRGAPGGAAKLPPTSRGQVRSRPRSDVRPPPDGRILPRGQTHAAHSPTNRGELRARPGPALPSNALQAAPRCPRPGPAEGAPRPAREAPRRPFPGRSAAPPASPPPPLRRRSAQGRAGREERSGAERAGQGAPRREGTKRLCAEGRAARAAASPAPCPAFPRTPAALTGLPRLIGRCAAHTAGPRGPATGSRPAPARLAAVAAAAAAAM